MDQIIRIGMDTSKHIFQLHGVNRAEQPVLRKKLQRKSMVEFLRKLPPTVIGIEACGGSHHWAQVLGDLGHEVKLLAPQLVKPYVKRNKNDAADAEEHRHLDAQLKEIDARLLAWHRNDECSRRLAQIPGVGPIGATMLVVGATAVIRQIKHARNPSPWLVALLKRKPPKLAAVALANKMARVAWKMMMTGDDTA